MVLVISAPSAAASSSQARDHGQSCRGTLNPCTTAAITPAAAGVGMPTKNFDPPGAMPWTLKRASLQAQQTRKIKQETQPISSSSCPVCAVDAGKLRTPQA